MKHFFNALTNSMELLNEQVIDTYCVPFIPVVDIK